MPHPQIQAASRERVPFSLWSPSRARTAIAAIAASAAALVPAIMVASPAQAASTTVSITPSSQTVAEGNSATFTLTSLTHVAPGDTAYDITVTGGNGSTTSADWGTLSETTYTWLDNDTDTLTLPISADNVVDSGETITVTLTNQSAPSDTVSATITTSDVGFSLTAPPVTETVTTPAVGATPAVQKTARVTASLSAAAAYNVTIPLTVGVMGDTALSSTDVSDQTRRDYTAPSSPSITIPAGQTSGYYDITLYDDALDEDDTQYITVTSPTAGRVGASPTGTSGANGTVRVNITDDDATPTLQISGAGTVAEGGVLGFPLVLSTGSERAVTVKVNTADSATTGTTYGATAGSDYTALADQTVTIPSYQTSSSAIVTTLGDSAIEASPEWLTATISDPSGATLGATTSATGGINDDEVAPVVTYSSSNSGPSTSFVEGDSAETAGHIYFTLDTASTIPVKLDYTFSGGTATSGVDYKGTNGSVTVAPGETTASIPVTIVGDSLYESPNETFGLVVTSPNGSVTSGSLGTKTFTITDASDTKPTWTAGDLAVDEGASGTTSAKVPVTLGAPTNVAVSFSTSISGGTTTEAGTNASPTFGANDYDTPTTTTVTIPAGSTTGYLDVPVNGDAVFEGDETATVTITPSTNSDHLLTTTAKTATLTVKNDDAAPKVTFNQTSGSEGTTIRVIGTITGVAEAAYKLKFTYAGTGDDPAVKDTDFSVNSTPTPLDEVTYAAGTTATLGTVADIFLSQDTIDEANESFGVTATESTATKIGITTATGVYKVNDDPGDVPPAVSAHDESIDEDAGSVDVHIDLTQVGDTTATQQAIKVPYWTADGSAKAGKDYSETKGTLTIAAGATGSVIKVPVNNDKYGEGNENFYLKLGTPTSPSGATIAKGTGDIVIKSNDGEGDGGNPDEHGTPTIEAPSKIVGGKKVTISGQADAGSTVELWGAPMGDDSDLKKITETEADDEGMYSFMPWIGTGYRFAAKVGDMMSEETSVQVQQSPVFLASSHSKGKLSLTVQGNPRGPKQTVIVQRWVNGAWTNAWRGTTGSNNLWKATVSVKAKSTVSVRAFVAGHTPDGLLPGYTATHKVTIK